MPETVFSFATNAPLTAQEVGAKALALMQLSRQGFPVPPGLVLTVEFFELWLAQLAARPEWPTAVASGAAQSLQRACLELTFTPEQRAALEPALGAFQSAHPAGRFAVRSSSPEEDLASASFAGVYETTLGVPLAGIEEAVRRSFASLFDERVFLYKRERGLDAAHARIAVILQQQIDADSAGVAFSLNPLNNAYDEALINASFGLGEAVVSGRVEPDVFVVDRRAGRVLETSLGKQGETLRLNPAGGLLPSARAGLAGPCLSPEQALRVTDLLNRVEAVYRQPVDIEWAIAGDQLYLLQARPITTYWSLPEEMVTAPGEPKRLYANSALIEQGLQQPISTLGTDFLGYVLKQVAGPVDKDNIGPGGMTFTAGGGYFMNLSYGLMLGMGKAALAPGSFADPQVTAILDSIDLSQYLSGQLPKRYRGFQAKTLANTLPLAATVMLAFLNPQSILRKYRAALPEAMRRFERLPGIDQPLRTFAQAAAETLQFFYGRYGIPMVLAGQMAQRRMRALFQQDTGVQDDLAYLGAALPGNKTTEMGEELLALAETEEIRCYGAAADFLADLNAGKLSAEFIEKWNRFIDEHGMRCPGEIDPATPRPKERPEMLFERLKGLSAAAQTGRDSASFFEQARAKREAAYRALHARASQRSRAAARAFEQAYRVWVTLGGYRETPKHYVIRVVDVFRRRALEIGRELAAQGRLDSPEQIFALRIEDIDQARANPALDLRALARERSLSNRDHPSRHTARVVDSRGKIFYPPRRPAADGELSGVPISPGVAQGRVKVLLRADEKELLPGEILVARATDPGWTPLFIHAAGIILEIGGALQHGAVVAREYGIPCVSGVDDVTATLRDGQLVEVDGSNGRVRVLDDDVLKT